MSPLGFGSIGAYDDSGIRMIPKPEAAMRRTFALLLLLFSATTSVAHYNMLIPDKAWANKGDKVTFTYQFGHPFEHELFDAPEPKAVIVILPDGKTQKIDKLTKIELKGADGKKVTGYKFVFEPETRGDFTFVLQTPPIWMEESKEFWQDTVKVVLHVQTQKNWDAELELGTLANRSMQITPLTRPYGLLPGMVFQAQAVRDDFAIGIAGAEIEIERYNSQPVKNPPPDELITFKTKTDRNGVFTFAFPDPGWWSMTSGYDVGKKKRRHKEGVKEGPLRERATFWLHVDEKK
jgi:cobalt/nickel transport protein